MRKFSRIFAVTAAALLISWGMWAGAPGTSKAAAPSSKAASSVSAELQSSASMQTNDESDDAEYQVDMSLRLVKDASQLTVGNLESGDVSCLIDGNTNAAVITKAGEKDASFVNAFRAGGFSANVRVCWNDGDASDKITKAEVLVSNDGKKWESAGELDAETDAATGMSFVFAQFEGNFKNVKFVPIATTKNATAEKSLALNITEFNVVPVIEILNWPLEDLVNYYEFGADDYAYGSNPGCIADEDLYTDFYDNYTNATAYAGTGTLTPEQEQTLAKKLQISKVMAELNVVTPEAGKYYYIRSAYAPFGDKSKTVHMYAPRRGNEPGWHVAQKSFGEAWLLEPLPTGGYNIKNAATGMYISKHIGSSEGYLVVEMTEKPENEQIVENINYAGQFTLRSIVSPHFYNAPFSDNGVKDDGPISYWTNDKAGSDCAWTLVEIPADELEAMQATVNKDLFMQLIKSFDDDYDLGSDPGQYPKAVYDAAKAQLAKAQEMADSDTPFTESEYAYAYKTLKEAIDKLNASLIGVETGYYAIADKRWSIAEESQGRNSAAWYSIPGNGYINSNRWEIGNPAFLWKITKLANGNYQIQNVDNGLYANNAELIQAGAAVPLVKKPSVEQTIKFDKASGRFEFGNTGAPGYMYHSARSTEGREAVYIVPAGSEVRWALHHFTDAQADSIVKAYPQLLRTQALQEMLSSIKAKTFYAYEYDFDMDSPIVTDASQFYSNNKAREGSYEALIDNDFDTHFITAFNNSNETNEQAYHYLRVDAGEGKTLPTKFGLHWRARGSAWKNLFRPIEVIYSVSDDAENWIDVMHESNPEAGFPNVASVPEYTSRSAIVTDKGYRYFKLTVIRTNSGESYQGYPFFTFSEFNLYPASDPKASSPAYDEEVKAALAKLEPVMENAQKLIDNNNASAEDIANVKSAYNDLLLVWKDTTDLARVFEEAEEYYPGVSVGDEDELFTFPEDKVTAFENALEEVRQASPFTDIKQREVARLDTILTNALNDLKASMHTPDPEKWYSISSRDESRVESGGQSYRDMICWIGGNTAIDGLGCGNKQEDMMNVPRTAWMFKPAEKAGQYIIYNCGTGWPIDKGNIVEVVPIGDGQIAMKLVYNGQYFYIEPNVLPGVPLKNLVPTVDGEGAWIVKESPEELTYSSSSPKSGQYRAYVFPFACQELPSTPNGEDVKSLEICGYETSADGKEIVAVKLQSIFDEGIPAAKPFIVLPDPAGTVAYGTGVKVDFHAQVNGPVTQEVVPANGLVGTFSTFPVGEGHLVVGIDSAYVRAPGYNVAPQGAYIDANQIVNDPNAEAEYILYVSGKVGLLNGIKDVIIEAKKIVNVYTTDGVLIRKNVKAADAVKGLEKGIYIVGKDKVLVR